MVLQKPQTIKRSHTSRLLVILIKSHIHILQHLFIQHHLTEKQRTQLHNESKTIDSISNHTAVITAQEPVDKPKYAKQFERSFASGKNKAL